MTFANTHELSESYRDRHGCGDELYIDSRFRSETLLAELTSGVDWTHELDTSEDDVATH